MIAIYPNVNCEVIKKNIDYYVYTYRYNNIITCTKISINDLYYFKKFTVYY